LKRERGRGALVKLWRPFPTLHLVYTSIEICKNSIVNRFWEDRHWTTAAYLELQNIPVMTVIKSSLPFPSDFHTVFQLYTAAAEARLLK
jgi:hypothetical protein